MLSDTGVKQEKFTAKRKLDIFYTCNHKGMFWTRISLDLNFENSVCHMIDVLDGKVTLGFSVIKLPSMFNSSICTWTLNAVYQTINLVLSNSYSWHTFLQWLSKVIEFIRYLQPHLPFKYALILIMPLQEQTVWQWWKYQSCIEEDI
jgi:hypothetical protein